MYIKTLSELQNPLEIGRQLALRVRQRRLDKNLAQEALAQKSGVSYASLRKFEATGEISLKSLIKIAIAMEMSDEFGTLFSGSAFASMDELLKVKKQRTRKRGTSHD